MKRISPRGDRPRCRRLLGPALAAPHRRPGLRTIPTSRSSRPSTVQDTDNQYIVNGDEPWPNADVLKLLRPDGPRLRDTPINGLIVNTVGGVDDKWSATRSRNLTYCVSTKFGTPYTDVVNAMTGGAALWEGATSKVELRLRPRRRTPAAPPATRRCCSPWSPCQHHAVHRPRVLPEHAQALAQRPGRRLDLDLGLLDAGQHPRPRARPHARLPPRAHAPRGRHLLRGQQLAPADALRLGVDHALPAVQRHVEQPEHDRHRPPGSGRALRCLIHTHPRPPSRSSAIAPSVPSGGGDRHALAGR